MKTQDKLERLCISAGLGTSQYSPRRYVGSGWREGGPGNLCLDCCLQDSTCTGGFLKAMKECVCTLLHFMPSLMNCTQCFMNLFCMRLYPPAGLLVCVLVFDKVSSCKKGLSFQMLGQSTPAAESHIYFLEQFKEKYKLK